MKLFKREKAYPSLIISEEKVQVLQLDKTKTQVVSLAEVQLERSVVEAGEVKDTEKLVNAFHTLFQAAKIDEPYVVVSIPENKSYTKVLTIPKLKAEELAEAVTWEAETYLPIPLDHVYMDWNIISEAVKNEVKILLIAVPKKIIDGYTAVLRKTGLTPVAYETTALSLIRLIEDLGTRVVVIEIGKKHAILALTKGQAIEASSIVSFDKDKKGEAEVVLIQTIKKMLEYYNGKRQEQEKVKSIFICGEGINQSMIDEISKGTNLEVKPCPLPVRNLPEEKSQNFAVVVSLAKKIIEAPSGEYTINLLPPEIQMEHDQKKREKTKKRLLGICTLVTAATAASSLITLLYLKAVYLNLESEKLDIPPPPQELGAALKTTNNANQTSYSVVKIGYERTFPQAYIASVVSNIFPEIRVVSINIDETQMKLRIVGRAQSRADLLRFKDNIEATSYFSEPILPLSSLQQSQDIDFVLTAIIKNDDN